VKLQKCATVNTGLVLSRKQANHTSDKRIKYKVITLKSILNNELDISKFENFFSKYKIPERYISKPGDIILRISEPYNAILITSEHENGIIPSSFYLIRISSEKIIAEYLYWYLNSEGARKQILRQKITSTMNVIKSSFVKNMLIPVPDIKTQHTISNLCNFQKKELRLLDNLKQEKHLFYSDLIKKVFDNNYEHKEG
jgi:restriction endonuclease S subunit